MHCLLAGCWMKQVKKHIGSTSSEELLCAITTLISNGNYCPLPLRQIWSTIFANFTKIHWSLWKKLMLKAKVTTKPAWLLKDHSSVIVKETKRENCISNLVPERLQLLLAPQIPKHQPSFANINGTNWKERRNNPMRTERVSKAQTLRVLGWSKSHTELLPATEQYTRKKSPLYQIEPHTEPHQYK